MSKWLYGLVLGLGGSVMAVAAGDPDQGQLLVDSTCAACHGAEGNSDLDMYPKLAGQYQGYLIKSLEELRQGMDGPRYDPIMSGMAAPLSDEDIENVTAYFSMQTMSSGEADPELVDLGEQLYRGGDIEAGVTACAACHGPTGLGNELAGFPKLAGQHAAYIELQLQAFKAHERTGDSGGMMQAIAENMSDEQMSAVSSYIQGLHGMDE